MKSKLLILDDDDAILQLLAAVFEDEEVELFLETDSEAAVKRVLSEHPNVAILDICLPKKSGLEVLREVKAIDPGLSVIMTTGYRTTQNAIEAMKHGAYEYLTKPFDIERLKGVFHKALECNLLNRKVRYAEISDQIDDAELEEDIMIGSSPQMIQIWKMVGKVAASDASILIQGPSGTGKELLARAIYNNSKRCDKTFLAVNCAALPENLLESELFGHEKGAFTDAHSRRIGKFEQCNGGTIFLDEIGEMSLSNQGKLLRVLENQEFERVGGNETIKVNVRVVAATNSSLVGAVKDKTFRLDLFYRLRVVSFYLPPLHERLEDLPLLVDLFVKKYSRQYEKRVKGVSPEALDLLMKHPWEGNIRELKNVINSVVLFCKGDVLLPEDFDSLLNVKTVLKKSELDLENGGDEYFSAFFEMLGPAFTDICKRENGSVYEKVTSGLEKALIQLALDKSNKNQVITSKLLGISRNTLRDRLERYSLQED
ncbi:MAG: sigma-54-dependent Fis family transcriptional regulator [Deltaproteobacteria bacterium]|nr:sigma-54-dependent Fis family transcriptional regulator [Deltaproteobacteria bacterium]